MRINFKKLEAEGFTVTETDDGISIHPTHPMQVDFAPMRAQLNGGDWDDRVIDEATDAFMDALMWGQLVAVLKRQ